jgi:hypothetical protein
MRGFSRTGLGSTPRQLIRQLRPHHPQLLFDLSAHVYEDVLRDDVKFPKTLRALADSKATSQSPSKSVLGRPSKDAPLRTGGSGGPRRPTRRWS